jgi:hypothetical protein
VSSPPGDSENDLSEQKFTKYLQDLLENNPDIEDPVEALKLEDNEEMEENDLPTIDHYLSKLGHENYTGPNFDSTIPIGTYVHMVHSNGIHNLAMINCECQGYDTGR